MSKTQAHTVYKLSDGTRVPSVTTYLGVLNKPAVIHWAWEQGAAGLDYRKVRDQAGDTGSLVHYRILSALEGVDVDLLATYHPNDIATTVVPMKKFAAWLREHEVAPILLETPMVSEAHRFGGTPDYYGLDNHKLTLLDFKTSGAVYPENFYQLAAYKKLLEEHGYEVESARVVRVSKIVDEAFEDRPAGNLENAWKIFLACQQIYELQKASRRTLQEKEE